MNRAILSMDVCEIALRLQGYDIQSLTKFNGEWEVVVLADYDNWATPFDICGKLNGTDKADFFSIMGIEKTGAMTYKARIKRVVSDGEESQM